MLARRCRLDAQVAVQGPGELFDETLVAQGARVAAIDMRLNDMGPLIEQLGDAVRLCQVDVADVVRDLGRIGEPKDVAALIAFLTSDECNYCTDAMFDINGGG